MALTFYNGAKVAIKCTALPEYMAAGDNTVPLVISSSGIDGASYDAFWAEVDTNGSNLAATLENGQPIPIDKVSCDPVARTMQVWVQWQNVSSLSGVPIYLQATSGVVANDPSCWTGAGYTGVWPLDGSTTDRAGNNDLTANGALPNTKSAAVGDGQDFANAGDYALPSGTYLDTSKGWRISFWAANNAGFLNSFPGICALNTNGGSTFDILINRGDNYKYLSWGADSSISTPYKCATPYTALTKISINAAPGSPVASYASYYNGVPQTITTAGGFNGRTSASYIGALNAAYPSLRYVDILDHFTVNDGTKSAAWEQREYNNQSTFSTNGVFAFELRRKKSIFIPILINLVKRANV